MNYSYARYLIDEMARFDQDKAQKNLLSHLSVFFEHLIKWKYIPIDQCSTWSNSVFRSIYDIDNDLTEKVKGEKKQYNTNAINYMNEATFNKAYSNGFKSVINEYNKSIKIKDDKSILIAFDTLEKVNDINSVKDYMLEFARDEKAKRYIIIGMETYFGK